MTLQIYSQADWGYHNIPAFSLKRAGIINKSTTVIKTALIVVMCDQAGTKRCPIYTYCNNPKCWDRQA